MVAQFHIIGSRIYDTSGNQIKFKGFQQEIDPMLQSDFDLIKSWGFNLVARDLFWADVQHYGSQPDNLNWALLEQLNDYIRLANNSGLYWLMEFRITFGDDMVYPTDGEWTAWIDGQAGGPSVCPVCGVGGPHHHWVYNPAYAGFNAYKNMIRKAVSYFESQNHPNLIGYNLDMFPYHRSDASINRPYFYGTVFPELYALHKELAPDKLIFTSIINQGERDALPEFSSVPVYPDAIYSTNFYRPYETNVAGEWDYNYALQDEVQLDAINFQNTRNVPVFCEEFGVIGEQQSKGALAEYKTRIMENAGFAGWRIWSYTNYYGSDSFSIFYQGTRNPKPYILAGHRAHNQTIYPMETLPFHDDFADTSKWQKINGTWSAP